MWLRPAVAHALSRAGANRSCRLRGVGSILGLVLLEIITFTSLLGLAAGTAGYDGLPLALIVPGRPAHIALQAKAITHTGCLLAKDGRFIQQDEDTQEVVELHGPDLGINVGNRVQVTGRASNSRPVIPIATSVLDVTSVSPRSRGGCLSVASTLDAEANPPKDQVPERRKIR
jgi:hypothetical protein